MRLLLRLCILAAAGGAMALARQTAIASGPDPVNTIYVADYGASSIDVFAPGANGNVAPVRTISGPATGINGPADVAVDSAGNVYSSNFNSNTITEYAPGASGNVAPIRTIGGSNSGLRQNDDISLAADGTLYVGNFDGSVDVFAPGASGNVAPLRVISGPATGLTLVDGVGADAIGTLYVDSASAVQVFAPGANGNVAPIRSISGPNTGLSTPDDVKVGFGGQLFVSDANNSVEVFAPGASGDATPTRRISGSNTGLITTDDLAVDPVGNIYVTDFSGHVAMFNSSANGNVAPNATIAGSNTTLRQPEGVALATPSALTLTTATPSTITLGSSSTDTATLSSGSNPTGSLIFKLYGPNDPTCSNAPAFTSPLVTVNGNGSYTSPAFAPQAAGTYDWVTAYSGDANNAPATVPCGDPAETVTVSASADPAITASGQSVSATEGVQFNGTVATFTDPDTHATASDYSVTVNWGDGSPASAGVVSGPAGGPFTVTGSHTYADEGSSTTSMVISDVDQATNSATVSGSATVGDAALTAGSPMTISATEGTAFSGTMGSFSDANPGATAANFTATINWGDGSPGTAGVVSGPAGGPFTVSGSHTYVEEGSYAIRMSGTDDGGSSATLTGTATVADAPLSGNCATQLFSGTAFAGPTATFTDQSPTGTLSDFSATINWGDNSSSVGVITGGPGNAPYTVSGTHTYATPGFFVISTTIKDVGGSGLTVACGNQAFVFPPSTPGCDIDGAGRITAANGDKAIFTVDAEVQPSDNDEDEGDNEDNHHDAENVQTYRDLGPATAFSFQSTQILSVTCTDHTSGSIYGRGTVGTVPVFFIIDVTTGGGDVEDREGNRDRRVNEDNGNGHATYRIRLSNGYDSGRQRVRNGKINVDLETDNNHNGEHGGE